jgi:hypothetical protein
MTRYTLYSLQEQATTTSGDIVVQIPVLVDISSDLLPNMTGASGTVSVYDIGSSTQKFQNLYVHDAYVDSGSLYVNGKKVLEDVSDTITITTDINQDLALKTTGLGDINLLSDHSVSTSSKGGIELIIPADQTGKDLNITNSSNNGGVYFTAAGSNQNMEFLAFNNLSFTADSVVVDADTTVTGTFNVQGAIQQNGVPISTGDVSYTELVTTSGDLVSFIEAGRSFVGGRLEYDTTTSLKYAFVEHNFLSLFSGDDRKIVTLSSEPTLANTDNDMGGTALTYDQNYAVYLAYESDTSVSFKLSPWGSDTARAIAWVTSTSYKIGHIRTEGGSTYACRENHTSGTFSTDLAAGKWDLIDSDGLFTFKGSKVYSSYAGMHYLHIGDIRLENDSGAKFVETEYKLLIWNRYNFTRKRIRVYNSTSSWTYSSETTWRRSNANNGMNSAFFLIGESQDLVVHWGQAMNAVGGGGFCGPDIDNDGSGGTPPGYLQWNVPDQGTCSNTFIVSSSEGYHYLTILERGSGGIGCTFRGGNYYKCFCTIFC